MFDFQMSKNKNDSDTEEQSSEEQSSRSQSVRNSVIGFFKGLVPRRSTSKSKGKSPRLSAPFSISRPTSPQEGESPRLSVPFIISRPASPAVDQLEEPAQPLQRKSLPISLPKPTKFDFGFENEGADDVPENLRLERAASTPIVKSPEKVLDEVINSNNQVLMLAERSMNIVYQDTVLKKSFFELCAKGTAARVQSSINKINSVGEEDNAIINARDENGRTGLWLAADNGKSLIVSILLQRGADPNIACNAGFTPIMRAVFRAQYAMVNELLMYQANPSIECNQGRSALHYAVIRGERSKGMVDLLMSCSEYADGFKKDLINAQNNDQKWTAAHIACRFGFNVILEGLIEHQADLSLEDAHGKIPALLASEFKHKKCLLLINKHHCPSANLFEVITKEYFINRQCHHQNDVILHSGVFNLFNRIDETWIERCTISFDLEVVTFTGWQSDHDVFYEYASNNGINMGQLGHFYLLQLDDGIAKTDLEGPPQLKLYRARKLEFQDLMYLPLEEIEAHNRCEGVITAKNLSEFKKILVEGFMDVNLSIPKDFYMPLIHRCVQQRFLPGFKALLAHAQTDVNSKYCGVSVLTEVVDRGLYEYATLLFDCLDLKIEDPDLLRKFVQDSSFGFASTRMLEVLIDSRRFPLDSVDVHGNNILHTVVSAGDIDAAKVIVTASCDVEFLNRRNKNKKTPFMLAISKGRRDIVKMMYRFPHKILVSKQALLRAVKTNDSNMVQILLESPLVDKNRAFKKSGRTALHLAVIQGNLKIVKMLLNGIWKPGAYVATQNVKLYKDYSIFTTNKGKKKEDVIQEVLLGDPIAVEEIKEVDDLIIGKVSKTTNAVVMMDKSTKIKYLRRGAPACETFMFNFLYHAMGIPMHESEGWLSNAFRDRFDEYDASSYFNFMYHLQMQIEEPFVFPPTDVNIKDSDGQTPIQYAIKSYFEMRDGLSFSGREKPDMMLLEFLNARPYIPFTLTDAQRKSNAMSNFNDALIKCGRWDMGDQIPDVALSGLWHPRDQENTFAALHTCFPTTEKKQKYSKPEIYPVLTIVMSYLERPGWWKSLLVRASIESDVDFVSIYGETLDSMSVVTEKILLGKIVQDSRHFEILEQTLNRRQKVLNTRSTSIFGSPLSRMLDAVKHRDNLYYGFKRGFLGNLRISDEYGNNLMHLCFSHDWLEGADIYLMRNKSISYKYVSMKNKCGDTPLMRLCQLKNLEAACMPVLEKICDDLKENGWVLKQANDGSTALHWAVLNGHTQVVEFLLSESKEQFVLIPTTQYDPYIGEAGTTPLDLALRLGFKEIAEMLENHNDIPEIYGAGRFRFIRGSWVKSGLSTSTDVVANISIGDIVDVISISKYENRVRAKLANGYCTLYNIQQGVAFVTKISPANQL